MIKNISRFIKLISLISLLFLPSIARCADVSISPPGPVFSLNSLVWGTSGANGFNNNFFFSPLYLSESVCVFVYNNNPTSSHTYSAQISYTGNITSTSPADGTWSAYSLPINFNVNSSPSIGSVLGAATSGAGLISINFTNSSTQAGSPDTANVRIIQTTNGNCMVANANGSANVLQSNSVGSASTIPIQVISENLGTAYVSNNNYSSSAAAFFSGVVAGSSVFSKTLYFDKLTLSSTVAISVELAQIGGIGTSCGTSSAVNIMFYAGFAPVASTTQIITGTGCSPAPGPNNPIYNVINIPANGTIVIDLRGLIFRGGQSSGLGLYTNAATVATITPTWSWYEK